MVTALDGRSTQPARALFRRMFVINGLVFTIGVDLLRTGVRIDDATPRGDLTHLIQTFNAMLDRLEAQRSASTAHALAAQEGERARIARELHDEIGQSLTVVLLGLKHAVDRAPEDLKRSCTVCRRRCAPASTKCGRSRTGYGWECSRIWAFTALSAR